MSLPLNQLQLKAVINDFLRAFLRDCDAIRVGLAGQNGFEDLKHFDQVTFIPGGFWGGQKRYREKAHGVDVGRLVDVHQNLLGQIIHHIRDPLRPLAWLNGGFAPIGGVVIEQAIEK